MKRCKTCALYQTVHGANNGECRRNPPQLGGFAHAVNIGIWPVVPADGWCGEWRPLFESRYDGGE